LLKVDEKEENTILQRFFWFPLFLHGYMNKIQDKIKRLKLSLRTQSKNNFYENKTRIDSFPFLVGSTPQYFCSKKARKD
jgi:hypothetical protein